MIDIFDIVNVRQLFWWNQIINEYDRCVEITITLHISTSSSNVTLKYPQARFKFPASTLKLFGFELYLNRTKWNFQKLPPYKYATYG